MFMIDTDEEIERLYTPLDIDIDYKNDFGYSGQYPFTREGGEINSATIRE